MALLLSRRRDPGFAWRDANLAAQAVGRGGRARRGGWEAAPRRIGAASLFIKSTSPRIK
jgi:hypothetical protein